MRYVMTYDLEGFHSDFVLGDPKVYPVRLVTCSARPSVMAAERSLEFNDYESAGAAKAHERKIEWISAYAGKPQVHHLSQPIVTSVGTIMGAPHGRMLSRTSRTNVSGLPAKKIGPRCSNKACQRSASHCIRILSEAVPHSGILRARWSIISSP